MRKVAFDFDSTLDREAVQDFASELIQSDDYEVWIVTSRPKEYKEGSWRNFEPNNDDLFEVSDRLGISRDHIHFTGYGLKCDFLRGKGFVFLLDDDTVELKCVMKSTACAAISSIGPKWRVKCEKELKKENDLDKLFMSLRTIEKVEKNSIKTKRQWMEIVNTSSIKFDRLVDSGIYFK